jgi:hypothetical protein
MVSCRREFHTLAKSVASDAKSRWYSTALQPYIASDPDRRDEWRAGGEAIVIRTRKR